MNRIYLLDIARGIAAISVAIFHYKLFYAFNINTEKYVLEKQPFFEILKLIYQYGWIAVQFFFLLSGFIFFKLYLIKINKKEINFYNFIILRVSRLYPLHFITLIFVLLMYLLLNSYNFYNPINADLKHFVYNLFLIQEWGISLFPSFNEPSWSISVELLMYLIFFYIASKRHVILYSILTVVISSILFFKFKFLGYGGYCFFVGGLSYVLLEKLKFSHKSLITLLGIVILLSLFILIKFNISTIFIKIISLTIFFPVIINFLYLFNKKNPQLGKNISILGDISYSIYLIHFPIILITLFLLNILELRIDFNSPTIFIIYLITTFFISICSFKFFEIPLKELIRKKYLKNDF